ETHKTLKHTVKARVNKDRRVKIQTIRQEEPNGFITKGRRDGHVMRRCVVMR
ncbi:unnamed protein product, partial [Arabidopsis halleri]